MYIASYIYVHVIINYAPSIVTKYCMVQVLNRENIDDLALRCEYN